MVFGTPPMTACVIFASYEMMVGRLAATLAFTTLSLFNILRFPLVVLPKAMRALSEALASINRVEEFMLKEVPTDAVGVQKSTSAGVKIVSLLSCHSCCVKAAFLQVGSCFLQAAAVLQMLSCSDNSLLQACLSGVGAFRLIKQLQASVCWIGDSCSVCLHSAYTKQRNPHSAHHLTTVFAPACCLPPAAQRSVQASR
jgi:hypothetical protein